jgi:glycerol uptake facilitator-like aquaporin
MFNQDLFQISLKSRNEIHFGISELIATFGLIGTIILTNRKRSELAPLAIASYIAAAYWFTSSTSFANPAVTLARAFTNSFAGIAPSGLIMFVMAQLMGAVLSFYLLRKLPQSK